MIHTAWLLLCALALGPPHPHRYLAADGTWARRPHLYRRHPNRGTVWTGTCRDGALTFAHARRGACSHHGGVKAWLGPNPR